MSTPFPLINAVLIELQDGKVFKDKADGDLIFIIHKAGFSFLNLVEQKDLTSIFHFLLRSNVIPQYFHIYDVSDE